MQRRQSSTSKRWSSFALSALALTAPLLLAMRCANEDITQRFELSLDSEGTTELVGLTTPYTGRLSLDLRVEGNAGGQVITRIQAQTSGDPDVAGCEAMTLGRERAADAAPWDGASTPTGPSSAYPEIGRLTVRSALTLPWSDTAHRYAGVIEAVGARTLVRVYSTADDLRIWDLAGNEIPPLEATAPASCDDIYVAMYEIPDERVRLAISSDEPTETFAVVEDCTAQRVVQRVCPGTSGPIEEYYHDLSETPVVVDRIESLGVGDTVIVEGECAGACPASIDLYAWVEPIACRTNNDCSGGRSCTVDGWCVKDPPPSCATGAGGLGVAASVSALLIVLRKRRRRS